MPNYLPDDENMTPQERGVYSRLRSAQENMMLGGSGAVSEGEDFYLPDYLYEKQLTVEQAIKLRERYKYYTSMIAGDALGFPDCRAVIEFAPLDPQTGRTLKDPRIIGIQIGDELEITEVPGRNLTRELWEGKWKRIKDRYHLRDSDLGKEGEVPSVAEKES